jgi:hypothetical protein
MDKGISSEKRLKAKGQRLAAAGWRRLAANV